MNHFHVYFHPMNEKELVQQAQNGDYEAFARLISTHQSAIYGLARRLAGNEQDAEDIVQDTLLKAIDKIDQFRAESSFGTWLYAIALNQARALLGQRKKSDLRPIEEYLPDSRNEAETRELYDWSDPASRLEAQELKTLIDRLVSELPYNYREAFLLRYNEELPVKEIAAITGESVAATKSRILRARLALREQLSLYFEESRDRQMS